MNTKIILSALLITMCLSQTALAQEDGGERREMLKQKMQERLQKMDTDGDGNLSKNEFMAQAEERFKKMDGNGDGMITPDERASMKERFKQGAGGGGLGGEQFP
jgi:Ca2+-binding EF-hand superfamily protein